MTYTPERIEAVAPHGVWRAQALEGMGPWRAASQPLPRPPKYGEYLSPDAIVQALNEPLVECGDCDGYGILYPLAGGTVRQRNCPECNGTGKRDPHADLRALIERLEADARSG